MPINQEIRTRIFPIQGLELEPRTPEGKVALGEDVQVVVGLVVGRSPQGTSLLSLADDGSLKVAVQGSGLTWYSYHEGQTDNEYIAANTWVYPTPFAHFTVSCSKDAAAFSIRNAQGLWLPDWYAEDGDTWDYDFSGTGIRIKQKPNSDVADYTIAVLG